MLTAQFALRFRRGARFIAWMMAIAMCVGMAAAAPAQDQQPDAPESSNPPAPPPSDAHADVPVPLPQGKKLILKDGTFQLAREYTVEGDRVRYWSIERSDWEELPTSLIDWDATKKAEADQEQMEKDQEAKNRARILAEETEGVSQVDASLEVHPGLLLPDGVGMFVLANRQFVALKQNAADSKLDVGREVEKTLAGVQLIPTRRRLELPGKHSAVQVGTGDLEFFMRTADQREPRMMLVHAQMKGDTRLVETESESVVEDATDKGDTVATLAWELAPGVYRFTIDQNLPVGEYAFVEATSDGVDMNMWDFGVNARGASSPAPATPAKP